VGRPHFRCPDASGQDAHRPFGLRRHHPRCRRCLLKGCERWFLPTRPQARYCSLVCQQAARHWRRWHASQRYRASTNGKERRRDQSQRYRVRRRQRPVEEPSPVTDPPATTEPLPVTPVPCEGQRPAEIPEQSFGSPCHRPGCYDCFLPSPRSPQQRFCSCSCRLALRRVQQRETRLQQRRRRGARPRPIHARPPP
jgi:hypothetical protein